MVIPTLKGKRVLILEEEPLIALDIQHVFESIGFERLTRTSTFEMGMMLAKSVEFDFATLTIRLNEKQNSLPIAAELKRRKTPYLFITSYDLDEARKIVADASEVIVQKPFRREVVRDAVLRVIGA